MLWGSSHLATAQKPNISPQSAQRPQRATVFQRIRETRLFQIFQTLSRNFTFEDRKYWGSLCVLCVLCGSNAMSGFISCHTRAPCVTTLRGRTKNPGDPPSGPTGTTQTFYRKARRDRKDALDLKNPREPGCPEFSEPRPTHPLHRTWKYRGILCVLCVLCGSFALSGFDPWPGPSAIEGRECATPARPVRPAGSLPPLSSAPSGRPRSRSGASAGTRSCA